MTKTTNFGKVNEGDRAIFSHGTHHSAGVAILSNNYTGDILESFGSDESKIKTLNATKMHI